MWGLHAQCSDGYKVSYMYLYVSVNKLRTSHISYCRLIPPYRPSISHDKHERSNRLSWPEGQNRRLAGTQARTRPSIDQSRCRSCESQGLVSKASPDFDLNAAHSVLGKSQNGPTPKQTKATTVRASSKPLGPVSRASSRATESRGFTRSLLPEARTLRTRCVPHIRPFISRMV